MRRGKPDANQREIQRALEQRGACVVSLAGVGDGCPDLVVGFGNRNYLLECKNPDGRGLKLTAAQENFHAEWRGQLAIVSDVAGAIAVVFG